MLCCLAAGRDYFQRAKISRRARSHLTARQFREIAGKGCCTSVIARFIRALESDSLVLFE